MLIGNDQTTGLFWLEARHAFVVWDRLRGDLEEGQPGPFSAEKKEVRNCFYTRVADRFEAKVAGYHGRKDIKHQMNCIFV